MRKRISTLLAWGALTLGACAPVPSAAPPPSHDVVPSKVAVPSPPAAAALPSLEAAKRQVVSHLRAGRHEAALETIEREQRRRGSEGVLQEELLQILREFAAWGEELFEAGEYERAGGALRLIVNHYPQQQSAAARLGFSRHDLQQRLDLCAERLMARGLADYRAGDLPAAIDTWKRILIFHAAHDGAKRGIQTAEIQLQNLRALQ